MVFLYYHDLAFSKTNCSLSSQASSKGQVWERQADFMEHLLREALPKRWRSRTCTDMKQTVPGHRLHERPPCEGGFSAPGSACGGEEDAQVGADLRVSGRHTEEVRCLPGKRLGRRRRGSLGAFKFQLPSSQAHPVPQSP